MMFEPGHVDDMTLVVEPLFLEAQSHPARGTGSPAVVEDHHGLLPDLFVAREMLLTARGAPSTDDYEARCVRSLACGSRWPGYCTRCAFSGCSAALLKNAASSAVACSSCSS